MDLNDQSVTKSVVVSTEVLPSSESELPVTLPTLLSDAGPAARFAYEEFFFARLRNLHTRKAYRHAVHHFLSHCENLGLELTQITPRCVGQYLDQLPLAPSTKKQHLAA